MYNTSSTTVICSDLRRTSANEMTLSSRACDALDTDVTDSQSRNSLDRLDVQALSSLYSTRALLRASACFLFLTGVLRLLEYKIKLSRVVHTIVYVQILSGRNAHLNGFLDGDCCAAVRPVEPAAAAVDVASIDLTNRDWRARFFIFMRCIFITSSGRFHFSGVQPLSSSNMTRGTALRTTWTRAKTEGVDGNKLTFKYY